MARAGRKDRGLLSRVDAAGTKLWYVRLWHEGRERRFGSFPTKTKAREFYEKAKLEQKEGRFFPERYQLGGQDSLETILDEYTQTLAVSGKAKTTIADERYYTNWWKGQLGGRRVNAIDHSCLESIQAGLIQKGLSPQTVLHYMKFLRHVFRWAIARHKMERSPFSQLDLPKIRPSRTRFLSAEEEHVLCDTLEPTHASWVRFAILTGLRKSEQFSLRWADVDLERGLITLAHTKSGGVQYVPLNDEAKGLLRSFDSWQRSVWVFPSRNPVSPIDADNFYGRIYLPAVKEAGLEGVTWHTLRHTFASRLAMSGQTPSTIAALLRHSNTDLVQRYAHLSPSHLRAAVEGVAAFGKAESPSQQTVSEEGQQGSNSHRTVTGTGIVRVD